MSFAKVEPYSSLRVSKLTNLKVAAMKAPSPATNTSIEEEPLQSKQTSTRRTTMISTRMPPPSPPKSISLPTPLDANNKTPRLNGATIVSQAPSLDEVKLSVNGVGSAESGGSVEDNQSNLSNSSTKQRSLETKSTGSVTTFAMDEKESIRPDDSASVRAIDEEEVGSTLSRNSTFYQEPEVVMPAMRGGAGFSGPNVANAARRYPTLTNPPQFGDLASSPIPLEHSLAQAAQDAPVVSTGEREEHFNSIPITPDEKIFDGLASQKDRISILQVEEKILAFITQEAASYMDFPPQNAYARLLIHRTAEYYGLHHWINEDGTTIRLFRNNLPSTRPTALAILAKAIPVGIPQPLGPAAVKIMRRAGVGVHASSVPDSTATSSSAPSKATSDAGISEDGVISPIEGTPNRDKSKMTREEREAQYKAARERIFGDFQELSVNEGASTGENSADLSDPALRVGGRSRKSRDNQRMIALKQDQPSFPAMDQHSLRTQTIRVLNISISPIRISMRCRLHSLAMLVHMGQPQPRRFQVSTKACNTTAQCNMQRLDLRLSVNFKTGQGCSRRCKVVNTTFPKVLMDISTACNL